MSSTLGHTNLLLNPTDLPKTIRLGSQVRKSSRADILLLCCAKPVPKNVTKLWLEVSYNLSLGDVEIHWRFLIQKCQLTIQSVSYKTEPTKIFQQLELSQVQESLSFASKTKRISRLCLVLWLWQGPLVLFSTCRCFMFVSLVQSPVNRTLHMFSLSSRRTSEASQWHTAILVRHTASTIPKTGS